jgi:hypothetical protein
MAQGAYSQILSVVCRELWWAYNFNISEVGRPRLRRGILSTRYPPLPWRNLNDHASRWQLAKENDYAKIFYRGDAGYLFGHPSSGSRDILHRIRQHDEGLHNRDDGTYRQSKIQSCGKI